MTSETATPEITPATEPTEDHAGRPDPAVAIEAELRAIFRGLDARTKTLMWLLWEVHCVEGITNLRLADDLMDEMCETLSEDEVNADACTARLYGMAQALGLANKLG